MTLPDIHNPRVREKMAVLLLTAFLFGWVGVCLTVQALQIHHQGYGSGIINRQHLPDQIRDHYDIPGVTTPRQLMDATSR
jgi:hypothetical protein